MKGYIVVTHIEVDGGRKPLRAFAVLGADHHDAVARVRHLGADGVIDVEAVLHLSDATQARLQLQPDEVWQL